jgi:hypothetical protein
MKKRRITFRHGISKYEGCIGLQANWQEWFGGYYWLRLELCLAILFIDFEITNRPPDEEDCF